MKLKPYPEYKDSGIRWIGKIPEGWENFRLKHVVNEFISGGTPSSDNEKFWARDDKAGINWVAIADMTGHEYITETTKKITREGLADKNLRILKKGTLIYSIFASLGKVSILKIDATTNQAILGLIPSKKIHNRFLKYYLNSLEEPTIALSNANTQNNLNSTIVKNIEMALPLQIEEQKKIVFFLDKKTAKIDAMIEKDKKLIALLKEKRTALINHAVTKGLNPPLTPPLSGMGIIRDKFKYIPYNPALKNMARENRKNPTTAEKKMWKFLQKKEFAGLKFTRQKPLDNFIADFYCAELMLVIEIDGKYHDNRKEQDKIRSEILQKKYGIKVIRYTNDQILNNPKEVLKDLYKKIKFYISLNENKSDENDPPDKGDKRGFKDSGIQWIGKIPEGWVVRRLRFNALVNPSGKKALSDPKLLVKFLPMEKVSENGEYDTESKAEYKDVSSGYTYFEDNDILVAKITPCFENGKGALVNNLEYGFGFGTTEFHVIRSYDQLDSKYLFYLTKTHLFRVTGEAFMEGAAGQKRVSTDFVKNFIMVTPPKQEQLQIVQYLDKATSKIDKTIKLIEKKIKLLEEYKKSLIHYVVTGKIDVREVKE